MNANICKAATRFVAVVSLTIGMLIPAAPAQNAPSTINAVALISPPVVMKKDGQLTGFSIDLWNAVAAKLNLQTNYLTAPDVAAAFDMMRSKKADVAITPVYYTTQRDSEFDYTYSVLNAGWLAMVPDTRGRSLAVNPLLDLLHLIFSPGMLLWLSVGLVLVLIPAHIVWFLDRGKEDSVIPDKRYFPGIFHGMIWAGTALVSQVQQLPGRWLPRSLALVWMFVGVVFIAFYTAQLTADLTIQEFNGLINGPGDLPGKRVATLAGTLPVAYLKSIGAQVQEYPTVEEMFGALKAQKVDAVVQAAPLLRYYATHDGMGKVRTVGDEFRKEDLGFLVQLNSPLRRRVNNALIGLHEDGTYEQLYNKWFGAP
jgi:polar amino acid transport system substrate-binding protein